jgi:hypothetical protein
MTATTPVDRASGLVLSECVPHLHQTVVKRFYGAQMEGHMAMTPCDQRDALSNEHRHNTEDDLSPASRHTRFLHTMLSRAQPGMARLRWRSGVLLLAVRGRCSRQRGARIPEENPFFSSGLLTRGWGPAADAMPL